ncbi:hypothetical protein [Paraburkholderia metrosideri]|nr:hypothetical protein [Paraburkholderia metrosideri]
MVEFVVAMTAVMGVLLLAIVMLGKFNDVRNRALMSSRYVAWERTVWTDGDINKALASDSGTTEGWSRAYGDSALSVSKTDAELKDEVMQRVIVSDRALLSSGDRKDTQLAAVLPAMWKDHGGNPLLASEAAVTVGTASSADPDSSNDMGALARWSIPTVDVAPFKTRLNLPTRTLQSGSVSISVGQNNEVLKRLWPKDNLLPAFGGLTFSDTNVLMTNTWMPDGSARNKALFSQAVGAANATVVPSDRYLGMKKYAPEISTLEFGRVRQDVVPPNRLSQ